MVTGRKDWTWHSSAPCCNVKGTPDAHEGQRRHREPPDRAAPEARCPGGRIGPPYRHQPPDHLRHRVWRLCAEHRGRAAFGADARSQRGGSLRPSGRCAQRSGRHRARDPAAPSGQPTRGRPHATLPRRPPHRGVVSVPGSLVSAHCRRRSGGSPRRGENRKRNGPTFSRRIRFGQPHSSGRLRSWNFGVGAPRIARGSGTGGRAPQ